VSYGKFKIAFWHPIGPAAGETPEEIIARKRAEIEANGWTLWSFQHRLMLKDWYRKLAAAKNNTVFVFCSQGRGAVDPARDGTLNRTINCNSYRFVRDEDSEWLPIPDGVKVPHPFRQGKKLASAFVIKQVISPVEHFDRPAAEWFSPKKGPWCRTRIPTRGEYLIRPGGTITMRSVSVILELRSPYLAVVSVDKAGKRKIPK